MIVLVTALAATVADPFAPYEGCAFKAFMIKVAPVVIIFIRAACYFRAAVNFQRMALPGERFSVLPPFHGKAKLR